jgi:hypothetical protein
MVVLDTCMQPHLSSSSRCSQTQNVLSYMYRLDMGTGTHSHPSQEAPDEPIGTPPPDLIPEDPEERAARAHRYCITVCIFTYIHARTHARTRTRTLSQSYSSLSFSLSLSLSPSLSPSLSLSFPLSSPSHFLFSLSLSLSLSLCFVLCLSLSAAPSHMPTYMAWRLTPNCDDPFMQIKSRIQYSNIFAKQCSVFT